MEKYYDPYNIHVQIIFFLGGEGNSTTSNCLIQQIYNKKTLWKSKPYVYTFSQKI